MDPELFSTVTNVAYLLGGFFDFLAFVALIVVALWKVRPVEPGPAYAIAALAGARFLCICGSRSVSAAFDPIPFNDMDGAIPIVLALFSFASPVITLSLWGAVIFAIARLAARAQR